jgi:hypothetical protein
MTSPLNFSSHFEFPILKDQTKLLISSDRDNSKQGHNITIAYLVEGKNGTVSALHYSRSNAGKQDEHRKGASNIQVRWIFHLVLIFRIDVIFEILKNFELCWKIKSR